MRLEGKTSEELDRLQRMLDEGKHLVMYDEKRFVELLDRLVVELASLVKRSLESSS